MRKQYLELALLDELLALWEQQEGDWKQAIRRKLDRTAADWSMYV